MSAPAPPSSIDSAFEQWLRDFLPVGFDRAVARRVYEALHFRDGDRVPIWEMVQNRPLYEHFFPDWRERDPTAVMAGICHKLGIDVTYGGMYPPSMLPEQPVREADRRAETTWVTESEFGSMESIEKFVPRPVDARALERRWLEGWLQARELHAPHTIYTSQIPSSGFIVGTGHGALETFCLALHEARSSLRRIWDCNAEHALVVNSLFAEHRIAPLTQICEDVAFKGRLICHPSILHEEFFPRLQKVIAPLKKAGIKVCFHSDGNITSIIDALLDCGIDMINPIERSAGMDIGALRRKYRGRLMFSGNVESHALSFGATDEVRAAVRQCVAEVGPGGGHFLQCDSGQFMPDVPLTNGLAYFTAARAASHQPARPASAPPQGHAFTHG